MKKKSFAILAIVCIAAFTLAACGGKSAAPAGSGGSSAPAGSGASAAPQSASSVETYDVGDFTVAVPEGWNAIKQDDILGEKDAEGNYPVDPSCIVLAKGVSDAASALTAPNVRVYHYSPDAYILDSKDFYDNVEDIDGVSINGTACTAYSGDSTGYVYQFIKYEPGDAIYEINILTSANGKDTGIKWDDPDVKTIMESLKTK